MKDFAIHSPNDGKLLIRLHDELVRHGFESDTAWNFGFNPNTGCKNLIVGIDESLCYFSHDRFYAEINHNLTPENFEAVLNEILNEFNIERRNPKPHTQDR